LLKEKKLSINDLLLDPNNPRFIRDLSEVKHVPDDKLEEEQKNILKLFDIGKTKFDEELDVTNISDLYDSMKNIGFVEIDRVVARPIPFNDKYLVIEGNRRISTVMKLLGDYKNGTINKPEERRNLESLMSSFTTITCMILDTRGLSQEEIDHKISVILGLRHHGSLLEWETLAKAYNIYNEYMSEEPINEDLKFDNNKVKHVANRLSIPRSDVIKSLKTYVAYVQLRERFPDVKDRHFSLIESGVTNKYLAGSYFKIDGETFCLDEESLAKMDSLCQFSMRDSLPDNKKKIISDPKKFILLGKLVDKRQRADDEHVKSYADDLIRRVEDGDDQEMGVDDAVYNLTEFENRKKWAEAIAILLQKQETELRIEEYTGTGNDRGNKDELKRTLEPLRKIMGV